MAKRKLKAKPKPKVKRAPRAKPTPRKSTLGDAIVDACSTFTSLGEEMRSWADNLEDKFSGTQKYEDVSSAAETLESFTEPSTENAAIAALEVNWIDPIPRHLKSRASQRDHAVYILDQCIEVLETFIADTPEPPEVEDEAQSLKSDIETVKDEVEQVEFPGMYG